MANATAKPAGKLAGPLNRQKGIAGWFKRNGYYFIAFFLPVILIYVAYAIFGLYPFKEQSVLCLDLNGQYVYYFEALRDAFHGDGSILYNWSRNLSGGYMGVIGYYLASPFTLIVMLMPRTMILGALLIMILCKLGTASVTFCYYVRKSKHVTPSLSVLLGTMFGMCAYGIIQTIDPMWLDGLVFLPLIALGVEYLVDDGRKINYIIPLAMMCVANFYIGFMCCIFTALYFLFYVCFGSDKLDFKFKPIAVTVCRMAIATAVAMCCAAFMVLPVYNALSLGKMEFAKPAGGYNFGWKGQFSVLEFFAQFCVNQYNSVNVEGKPEVYCGVLAFLCMPLFFLNRRIPKRKRIGYGFLLISLFCCMFFKEIDIWWHGGQMPNWLPFRYSFVFSFVLLSMTAMTLRYASSIKKEMLGACFGVIFVLLMIIDSKDYLNMKGKVYLDSFKSIWMTVIFMAIYCGLIILMSRKNPSKMFRAIVTVGLALTVSFELTYNAVCEFKDIHTEVAYSTRKSYRQYVQTGRDLVDQLEAYDPGFYRAEKTYTRCINDNSAFGLRGITHSSSVMNTQILKFIEAMGYANRSYSSGYDGNTPLADSMLGIKYVLDKGDSNKNVLKKGENSEADAAYKQIMSYLCKSQSESDINVNVYENPNALSIGYMVDADIEKIAFFGNDNPFNSQNLLLSTASGNTTFNQSGNFDTWHQYFYNIPITEELRLNECIEDGYTTQRRFREVINGNLFDSKNPTVHAADPTVDIFFEAQTSDPIYLFFKTENKSKVNLWLADQWNLDEPTCKNKDGSNAISLGSYLDDEKYCILYVGEFEPGQQLQLRMTLLTDAAGTREKYAIIKNFFFCHFNSELFEADINTLKEQQWDLTTYGGRKLEGKITAKENQVMMTSIPAEPGWEIWIDGKKYTHTVTKTDEKGKTKEVKEDYMTLFQGMIGVELEPGEHTVKMKYTPPGFTFGLFLLVCGIGCIVLFWFYDKKNNKVLLLMAENRKKGIYEMPYEDDPEPSEKPKRRSDDGKDAEAAPRKVEMVADEIRKLKELLDEGILTQEEFDAQKKKLLDQ